jgi:hypothetical protein
VIKFPCIVFVLFFREHEIKHLVTAATRGPNCLRDYIRIIKEYVKVLGKKKLFTK